MSKPAFSLVELLVVVTIIVILISILTPALDQAIYQAELTACAARLHAMSAGTLAYAMHAKRHYPDRSGVRDEGVNWLPNYICTRDHDERPVLLSYMPARMMLDPFGGKIDIEENMDGPVIYVNYLMWFGFQYQRPNRERGMFRIGDRWTMPDALTGRPAGYNILASDEDTVRRASNGQVFSTHPDRDGVMFFNPVQDYPGAAVFWIGQGNWLTFSWWENQNTNRRGELDTNYGYDDGSVTRFNGVKALDASGRIGDDRMNLVPEGKYQNPDERDFGVGRQVPRR